MKHTKKITLIFLLHTFAAHLADAQVNMADGSFERKDQDITLRHGKSEFTIERIYKSRSLYQGDFGIGWCSNIDLRLEIKTPRFVQVAGCFYKSPLSFLRQKESFFQSVDDRQGKLLKVPEGWLWVQKTDLSLLFTHGGQLTAISFSRRDKITIDRDPQGRILGLKSKTNSVDYQYFRNHLVRTERSSSARASGEDVLQYKYDRASNLNQVLRNQKIIETITYDAAKDQVSARKNRQGCIESYQYSELSSTVERLCPEEGLFHHHFEFRRLASGQIRFHKMTTLSQGQTTGRSHTHPRMGGAFTNKEAP